MTDTKLDIKSEVKNFIQSRQDDINTMTVDYVKAVIALEKEIKAIKDDIKALTNEAKENQVNTKHAKKAIAKLKYLMKTSQDEINEEDEILSVLQGNGDIISEISQLIQK
jgi:uncharacterized protein (UPF0335 family)